MGNGCIGAGYPEGGCPALALAGACEQGPFSRQFMRGGLTLCEYTSGCVS